MASLFARLLLVTAAAWPARAAMAAWWNEIGPQVILQNETTNQIRYSPCNSFDEARYSHTDGRELPLEYRPKTGTPLAGVGWYNRVLTVASIFYVDDQGNIATGVYHCNMDTGMFRSQGNFIISGDVPSIHTNSGIAAVVLGEEDYRVYYHDEDQAINELAYINKQWRHRGTISDDINSLPALAAAFSGNDNITVASSRDEQNIAVTRWNRDDTWFRSTLPQPLQDGFTTTETDRDDITVDETAIANFTLAGWDGKTKSIGISIDKAFTRSIWYIGNDSSLHHTANQDLAWSQQANQPNSSWPPADTPNADLAVAYNFNTSMVRIYYMVNEQLAEIKFENNTWTPWSALPTPPPQPTQTQTPSPANPSPDPDTGLSTGAKAGIGVGISLGAIALGAITAVLVLARRKKAKQQEQQQKQKQSEDGSTAVGDSSTAAAAQDGHKAWDEGIQVQQLDGTARAELYAPQPVYELPSEAYSRELVAEDLEPEPEPQLKDRVQDT